MKTYKVGGSVRDKLMGIAPSDIDYVVVGSTPEYLLSVGYTLIGKDFPVFLHPITGDEYALARQERSSGQGHNDFSVETNNVSLEQDLARRDLTINAMALSSDGTLIDPFNGASDIENKLLKHTSEAFREDPVRVLRLARFRAQFGEDWKIYHATKALVYDMRIILGHLQVDRVWKEVEKASKYDLSIFFNTLFELGVLEMIFPYIHQLTTLKEGNKQHREASVFEHTMTMLKIVKDESMVIKMSVLYHDIAKPFCYRAYGSSAGHDEYGLINDRIDIHLPAKLRKEVLFHTTNHVNIYKTYEMKAATIATFLESFKSINQLNELFIIASADDEGRIAVSETEPVEKMLLITALHEILEYSPREWIDSQDYPVASIAIKQHIHNYNIGVVKKFIKEYR